MHIRLDRSLFDVQSREEAAALVYLLSSAAHEVDRHAILTDPLYDRGSDNREIDDWLKQKLPFEADGFRAALENGPRIAGGTRGEPISGRRLSLVLTQTQPRPWHLEGPLAIRVERRAQSDWANRRLTLSDAADLLREPVHLVLENARNDLAFVRHLAGPTNGATLKAILRRPGLIERHGGGSGEVKMWLEELTDGPPTPEKWRRMLRAWVLFDQDAGNECACRPSASAVKLMEACESVVAAFGPGLSWICLRRREIESYVPDSGLLDPSQRANTRAFAQKVIEWRAGGVRKTWAWALDLKNGLHGDRHSRWKDGLSEEQIAAVDQGRQPLTAQMLKAPFVALTTAEIDTLRRGFGKRALADDLLAEPSPSWTYDIPQEYDRGPDGQAPRAELIQSLFDRM